MKTSTFKNTAFLPSLGYTVSNAVDERDMGMYPGYIKLGNAGANSGGVIIPAMGDDVDVAGSDVTLSFKACPWCEYTSKQWSLDNENIKVIVTDGSAEREITATLKISDHTAGTGYTTDYNAWKDVSIDIPALKQNETIKLMGIGGTPGGRFLIDEISIVKR